jgi:hypothetical protein
MSSASSSHCFLCKLPVLRDDDLLLCDLCEREAHQACLLGNTIDPSIEDEIICKECSTATQKLVDEPSQLGKSFTYFKNFINVNI